jgi:hypothetical protein
MSSERVVSYILSDGQKVHSSGEIVNFNNSRGVQTITAAPHSQWQNPSERGIQTIANAARASLIHGSGGGKGYLWGWATLHAGDSINLMYPPHNVAGHEGKTRGEIAYPERSSAKVLRTHHPFLCLALATEPHADRRSDFEPRTVTCVHLRYDPSKKAYALLTIPNLYLKYSVEVKHVPRTFPLRVTDYLGNRIDRFLMPHDEAPYNRLHGPDNILREPAAKQLAVPDPVLASRASTRARKPADNVPGPDSQYTLVAHARTGLFSPDQLAARTPKHIRQALSGPDAEYWLPSILKDFDVLRSKQCVINITTVRPPGPSPPSMEQRFKIKHRGGPTTLEDIRSLFKTRTIARGDHFKHGTHYDATEAPVVHTPALKMLLAWAVARGLLLYSWDISGAFYDNTMDRVGVVVKLPLGYNPVKSKLRPLDLPPLYGELAKGVPGIPQGSLLQYEELSPDLVGMQFEMAAADKCIFVHTSGDMATSLHVDDGVLACPSLAHAERFFGPQGLGAKRELTWEPLSSTLGVSFVVRYSPTKRSVFMHQKEYADTILERAGMGECNTSTKTPAIPGHVYTKSDCPVTDEQRAALAEQGNTREKYHTLVASLNFLVAITRDDMRFIQGKTSKYVANPGRQHFSSLKHQLRFLKRTANYGIEFVWRASDPAPVDGPIELRAWSDSSFADDVDTGRTTLGELIQVNGATISASSKLSSRVHSCVNHSELQAFGGVTAGSDHDAGVQAFLRTSRTVTWCRGLKAAFERRCERTILPIPVCVDNSGVISMLEGITIKAANRHIYRTLAEAREMVQLDAIVIPVKVNTEANIANALTKQEVAIHSSAAQLRLITGPMSA